MKSKLLKRFFQTIPAITFVMLLCLIYILTQQPKVWFNREWAGICLLKGGYRSWSMRFCDGQADIDGKLQPVVITASGYRVGYYHWPVFGHSDIRWFLKAHPEWK